MKISDYSNKKGNMILDVAYIVIGMAVFFLIAVNVYPLLTGISTNINESSSYDNLSKEFIVSEAESFPQIWDGLIAFGFIILWIISMFLASYIQSNPILLGISLILLIGITVGIGLLGSGLIEMTGSIADSFPYSQWIFEHIVLIVLSMSVTIGASMYFGLQR